MPRRVGPDRDADIGSRPAIASRSAVGRGVAVGAEPRPQRRGAGGQGQWPGAPGGAGEDGRGGLQRALDLAGWFGPQHQRGVASGEFVSEAFARAAAVDRGTVEDQSDRLGAACERTAEDLLALALRLGDHTAEDLVDVPEQLPRRPLQQLDELRARRYDPRGVVRSALPREVLSSAVGVEDHVEVDAAAHDRAGDVQRLGWDVDRGGRSSRRARVVSRRGGSRGCSPTSPPRSPGRRPVPGASLGLRGVQVVDERIECRRASTRRHHP